MGNFTILVVLFGRHWKVRPPSYSNSQASGCAPVVMPVWNTVLKKFQSLQNLASSIGVTPNDIVAEVENIITTGWALAPSDSVNKRRVELGLQPIPLEEQGKKDLQTIAKATELLERLEKIKERQAADAKAAEESVEEGGAA
jgi:hypothetical protein